MALFVFIGDMEFLYGSGIQAMASGYCLAPGYKAIENGDYWIAVKA